MTKQIQIRPVRMRHLERMMDWAEAPRYCVKCGKEVDPEKPQCYLRKLCERCTALSTMQ